MATCPPLDKLVGLMIEDLELVRLLGEGGMGVTYEGRQHSLGRDVCVKFLRSELVGDRRAYERFTREAIALSNLRDKNVVSVYSFGLYDGTYPYIVMELCCGQSLRQSIATANGDWKGACTVFLEICDVVCRIHSAGIVHRDLKPDNILIAEPQNTVKIIDFGLAVSGGLTHSDTLTSTGAIIGSPHYMAPECFTGKNRTALIDVYALGIIFYEMVTGHPPFADTFMPALAYKRITEALPPLSVNGATADERGMLDAFISKSCAVSPIDRFQSCQAMADCMRLIIETQSHDETLKVMLGTPRRRRTQPSKLVSSLVAIVVLLCGITALVCFRPGATDSGMFSKSRNVRSACVSILSDVPQHRLSQFSNLSYPELKEAQENGSVPETARSSVQRSLSDYRLRVKTNTVELTRQICAKQSISRFETELLRKCAEIAQLAGAEQEAVLLLLAAAERTGPEDSAQFRADSTNFVLTHLKSLSNVGSEVPRVKKLIDSLDCNNKAYLYATLVSLVLANDKVEVHVLLSDFARWVASASMPELEACRPKMDGIIAMCIDRGEKKEAQELLAAVIRVDITKMNYGSVGCQYQLLSELSGETDRKETGYLHNSLKYFEKDNLKNPAAFATLVKLANYSRTPAEARGYLARASRLLAGKDSSIMCDYWGVSANVFANTGELHKAREYALLQLQSLRHYRGIRTGAEYRVWLVRCTKVRHNLAWIFQRAGDIKLAVEVLTEAEREATANGLVDYEVADVKLSRSELFQRSGQWIEALSCLDTSGYAVLLQSLPAQQSEMLRFELARRRIDILAREARRYYQLKSSVQLHRVILEAVSAFKLLDESIEGPRREKIIELQCSLAGEFEEMGESAVAISLYEQILVQLKRAEDEPRAASVAIALSRIFEKRKEWSKAISVLKSRKRWFLENSDLPALHRVFDLCELAKDTVTYDELRSDVENLVDSRRLRGISTSVWCMVERLGNSLEGSVRALRLYGAALELPLKPSLIVCERVAMWGVNNDSENHEWQQLLDKAAVKMEDAPEPYQPVVAKMLAVAFRCAGNIPAAERYWSKLERLAIRQWNAKPGALAHITLRQYGELLANTGRPEEAAKYFNRASELTLQSEEYLVDKYAQAYNLLVSARYAESIDVLTRALAGDRCGRSPSFRQDAATLIALNEYHLGNFSKADAIWAVHDRVAPTSLYGGDRTRLHVFAAMGDERRYRSISKRWAISPYNGEWDGACFRRLHLELSEAEFLMASGLWEAADKAYDKWFRSWDDVLARLRRGERVGYLAHGLHRLGISGLGLVDLELGRYSEADEHFSQALHITSRGDYPTVLTNHVLVGRVLCALRRKQPEKALKFLRLLDEGATTVAPNTISPITRGTILAYFVQCERLAAQSSDSDSKAIQVILERIIKEFRACACPCPDPRRR